MNSLNKSSPKRFSFVPSDVHLKKTTVSKHLGVNNSLIM